MDRGESTETGAPARGVDLEMWCDGRGGEIRTPDPLLPKQDWQFFQCRLQWWWV